MADEEPQERFLYAILSRGAPQVEVEVEFKDGRVLLPEWIIESTGYFEMTDEAVKEFRDMAARVPYEPFRLRMQQEASLLERRAEREALNNVQGRIVASWQANMARARSILTQMQRGRWPR